MYVLDLVALIDLIIKNPQRDFFEFPLISNPHRDFSVVGFAIGWSHQRLTSPI